MKALLRGVSRLYPPAWRARYGEELDALIDDLHPRWRDVADIVRGAVMMQISRLALTPVVLGLAGGLAGAAFSLMTPGVYASSSSVQVQMADPAADAGGLSTLLQTALAETVVDKKAISVSVRPGSVGNLILDVSGSADSAAAARQLTERAAAAIINANLAASERGGTPGGTQSRIVEAANLPLTPRRFTERSALAGAALGAAFGVVVAVATSGRRRKQA